MSRPKIVSIYITGPEKLSNPSSNFQIIAGEVFKMYPRPSLTVRTWRSNFEHNEWYLWMVNYIKNGKNFLIAKLETRIILVLRYRHTLQNSANFINNLKELTN